jgi:GNAT superfamily N-acetyltransferase
MEIRPTTEDDWERLRDVRLRALAEAPSAFGSTLARERGRTEAEWRQWAGRGRTGRGVTFVAEDGERFVGLAGGYPEEEHPEAVHLVSMWVDPAERQGGLGRALVDAVVGWARDRGALMVNLWVTDGNGPAIALYRSCGFQPTGQHQPLPSNTSLREEKYRLDLTSRRSARPARGRAPRPRHR